MLVVDGNGLPLGFHLESANRAEVKLAEQTLDTIRVVRPRGRPKRRPQKLVADRGYDSSAFRAALRRRGIAHVHSAPSDARQRGEPSADAQWSRAKTTIDSVTVEIVHSQMTKPNGGTVTGGGEDIADLDLTIGHNDTINEEFDKRSTLLEGGRCWKLAACSPSRTWAQNASSDSATELSAMCCCATASSWRCWFCRASCRRVSSCRLRSKADKVRTPAR